MGKGKKAEDSKNSEAKKALTKALAKGEPVKGRVEGANRGGLMTAALTLFALAGFLNGYASARMGALFGFASDEWQRNALAAALFAPGVAFSVFFALNLLAWEERSAGAAPFTALLSVCALWFLVLSLIHI